MFVIPFPVCAYATFLKREWKNRLFRRKTTRKSNIIRIEIDKIKYKEISK